MINIANQNNLTRNLKKRLQEQNQTALEQFILDKCFHAPGECIKLSEFWEGFCNFLEPNELGDWTKAKMGRLISRPYLKGRRKIDAQWAIGNISFEQPTVRSLTEFVLVRQMLTPKEIGNGDETTEDGS